jgi:hypothetical protein
MSWDPSEVLSAGEGVVTRGFRLSKAAKIDHIRVSMEGDDIDRRGIEIRHPVTAEWKDEFADVKPNEAFSDVRWVYLNKSFPLAVPLRRELGAIGVKSFGSSTFRGGPAWSIKCGLGVNVRAVQAVIAACTRVSTNSFDIAVEYDPDADTISVGFETDLTYRDISPDTLKALADPKLSDLQFHTLIAQQGKPTTVEENPDFKTVPFVYIHRRFPGAEKIYEDLSGKGVKRLGWSAEEETSLSRYDKWQSGNRSQWIEIKDSIGVEAAKAVVAVCLEHNADLTGVAVTPWPISIPGTIRIGVNCPGYAATPREVLRRLATEKLTRDEFHRLVYDWMDPFPELAVKPNPDFYGVVAVDVDCDVPQGKAIVEELKRIGVKALNLAHGDNPHMNICLGANVPVKAAQKALAVCFEKVPGTFPVDLITVDKGYRSTQRIWIGAGNRQSFPHTPRGYMKKLLDPNLTSGEFNTMIQNQSSFIETSLLQNRPTLVVKKAIAQPVIDGKIDDPVWRDKPDVTNLVDMRLSDVVPAETACWIRYDDENCFAAIRCQEPAMDQLRASTNERDGALWEDDSVEFLLDTGGDKKSFYHFLVNSKGVLYDAMKNDKSFNINVRVGAERGKDSWIVELAIPWAELKVASPVKGTKMGFLLARNRQAKKDPIKRITAAGKVLQYPLSPKGNQYPEFFGTLEFQPE